MTQQVDNVFEGMDTSLGTEMVNMLGMKYHEIPIPDRYARLKEVVNFFGQAPDRRSIVSRITFGKQDKLDALFQYVQARKEYHTIQQQVQKLNEEALLLEQERIQDDPRLVSYRQKIGEQVLLGNKIKNELSFMENNG